MIEFPLPKPSKAEFEELLDLAREGIVRSDTGMPPAVQDALLLVSLAAPDIPKELVDAAKLAFKLSQ